MFQEVQMETEMNTDSGVETAESLPTGEIIMAKTEMEAESWLAEICYKIPTSFESQGRGFVATFTKIFPSWTQFIKNSKNSWTSQSNMQIIFLRFIFKQVVYI